MKKIIVLAVIFLCSCSGQNVMAIRPMMTYGVLSSPQVIISTSTSVMAVYTPVPDIAITTPQEFVTVTAIEALNLRAAPDGHILTQILTDESLEYLGKCQTTESGHWLNVMYGKIGGWVNEAYVDKEIC